MDKALIKELNIDKEELKQLKKKLYLTTPKLPRQPLILNMF